MAPVTKKKKSLKPKSLKENKDVLVEETLIVEEIDDKNDQIAALKQSRLNLTMKVLGLAVVGVALFLFAQKYRGLVIAGMVNSKPVTRMELNSRLMAKYGKATLDEIVTENLLLDQAKKNNINITEKNIDDEIASYEQKFGSKEQFMEVVKNSGITDDKELREQVKLQLIVKQLEDKMFKESVTEDEVNKYFDDNKQYLGDKKFDDVKADIESQLLQQKIQTKFTEWFGKIRTEAKIDSFI